MFVLWYLAYFTECNVFEVCPCCSLCRNFWPFLFKLNNIFKLNNCVDCVRGYLSRDARVVSTFWVSWITQP